MLVATIVSGTVSIVVILITLFVLGTAETFADSASSTLVPSLVAREDLALANSRLQGAFLLTNQLVAPPIGAFLFAVGDGHPVRDERRLLRARRAPRLTGRHSARRPRYASGRVCGRRWPRASAGCSRHPPMRTLALTIFTFNVTFGAAWSVLVLYANERLGMGPVGSGS